MNLTDTETEIRDLTVQALRDAAAGFTEFDHRIHQCSTAFDEGDDARAQAELAALVTPLGGFAQFCDLVMRNCGHMLLPRTVHRMSGANDDLREALRTVVEEAEDGNPNGVGDACRIDLAGALHTYRSLFPEMARELEQA